MDEIFDVKAVHNFKFKISRNLREKFNDLVLDNPKLPGESQEIVIISCLDHMCVNPCGNVYCFSYAEELIYVLSKLCRARTLKLKEVKSEAPAWEASLKRIEQKTEHKNVMPGTPAWEACRKRIEREGGKVKSRDPILTGSMKSIERKDKFLILPYDKAAEILDQPEFAEWKSKIVREPFYAEILEHVAFLKRAEKDPTAKEASQSYKIAANLRVDDKTQDQQPENTPCTKNL